MSPIRSGSEVQPSAPWRTTDRRFLTSSSTLSTSWFLVIVAPASEVVSVGSNSTSKSRPPAMKSRSEEHTSELQSLMRISYAVFCLKKNKQTVDISTKHNTMTQP